MGEEVSWYERVPPRPARRVDGPVRFFVACGQCGKLTGFHDLIAAEVSAEVHADRTGHLGVETVDAETVGGEGRNEGR